MTEAQGLRLRWPAPAADWTEAIPIGNGRLGAMVFGGARQARWQINDATVWSGTPSGPAVELAKLVAGGAGPARLEEVRSAISRRDYRTAEALLMSFEGPYSQEFLPFAQLDMLIGASDGSSAESYAGRELDLADAVVDEHFTVGTATLHRRSWASHPAGALCVQITSEGPVDVDLSLSTPLRLIHQEGGPDGLNLQVAIPADGAPLHEVEADAFRYSDSDVDGFDPFAAAALSVESDGVAHCADGRLQIGGARRILVTFASSTNAAHWWQGETTGLGCGSRAARLAEATHRSASAVRLGAQNLLAEHLEDVRPLLGSTTVQIGRHSRLVDVARDFFGTDDGLKATVLVQYGRYLLAAASRPGGPPANLQGIWNDQLRPAWSSNYTININTQMNYWGAETSGLGDCHVPLFDLLDRLAANGTAVARELYGARGWVAHHNSDLWGWSLPVGNGHGNPSWAIWMLGGTWLSDHLWQHYEFSLDRRFLRERAWPVLSGAALFALDWLIDDGDGGWLRTSPSTSPENLFVGPGNHPESLDESSFGDIALIRKLFNTIVSAAAALGEESDFVDQIRQALGRLRPPAVTSGGWLQEWSQDYTEVHPQHRHMSQMLALYPLGLIDPETTPELAAASAELLDRRGPGAMGWSWAWKIALRARLGQGDAALSLLQEASEPFTRDHHRFAAVDGSEWGGLLPNLLSTHAPFQIDGNYGVVGAVIEMMLQSAPGTVRLLPALPRAWTEGRLSGVRARGGLKIALEWDNGELVRAALSRGAGEGDEPVRVVFSGREMLVSVPTGAVVELFPENFRTGQLAVQSGAS
jgi:hypothetical protein